MNYPIIAIATIEFLKLEFKEEDIREIEILLRSEQDIYHLNMHKNAITFYMWGKDKISYGKFDQIKKLLKDKGYTDFVITVDEYVKTGQKYHYNSSEEADAK